MLSKKSPMTSVRLLSLGLLWPLSVMAKEFQVDQIDQQFSARHLQIAQGDTVRFTNKDPYFHNIFSLSDNKVFDLGSFAQGQSRGIRFDKSGKVEVECAIHPNMKMVIEVKPTP